MTIATMMRIYGQKGQVIDNEYASDKAQIRAMSLYIKDLEKMLDMETDSGEDDSEPENTGGAVVLSWADFLGLGKLMRESQRQYFKTRDKEVLIKSKELEKAFDRAVAYIEAKRECATQEHK